MFSMPLAFGFAEINSLFRKLLKTHNVVHIHPNNVAGLLCEDQLLFLHSWSSLSIGRIGEFSKIALVLILIS